MQAIERVQWGRRITLPRRLPRVPHREQHTVDCLCGQAVRLASTLEVHPPVDRWPHGIQRGPAASRANGIGEAPRVVDQELTILLHRRRPLLQDDEVPAALPNGRHCVPVVPVIFETVIGLGHHARLEERLMSRVGERLDDPW